MMTLCARTAVAASSRRSIRPPTSSHPTIVDFAIWPDVVIATGTNLPTTAARCLSFQFVNLSSAARSCEAVFPLHSDATLPADDTITTSKR